MKWWKLIAILVLGGSAATTWSESTSAQSISVTREIKIQTQVLPTHTIILDSQGNIDEIISNTNQDVKTPKVYKEKVTKDTATTLTPEVHANYQQLVKPGKSHVGTIYKQAPLLLLRSMHSNAAGKTTVSSYTLTGKGLATHQSSLVSESRM